VVDTRSSVEKSGGRGGVVGPPRPEISPTPEVGSPFGAETGEAKPTLDLPVRRGPPVRNARVEHRKTARRQKNDFRVRLDREDGVGDIATPFLHPWGTTERKRKAFSPGLVFSVIGPHRRLEEARGRYAV